jgi:hypothetical protein
MLALAGSTGAEPVVDVLARDLLRLGLDHESKGVTE